MSRVEFDPVVLISEALRRAYERAFPDAEGDGFDPLVTPSRRAELGDYQSNCAMPLGKRLRMAPREVAARLIEHLDPGDLLEAVGEGNIAGPGFINLRLRGDALARLLVEMDTAGLGVGEPDHPETVVVDLVGVNLAKQMHVGHLRSTIIGDAISRLFARLGHRVIRQNHVGDWGLPIAMVTAKVMELRDAGAIDLDRLTLDDLDRLYRQAQSECAADTRGLEAARRYGLGPKAIAELEEQVAGAEAALKRAKQTLIDLQARRASTMEVWRRISEITMRECLAICHELNVEISEADSAGESSYAEELGPMVEDLLARGVAEVDDGAVVVRVEGFEQPCLIRKSDGGFLYATTDIAAIRRRVQEMGADEVVYCVDARQSLHFDLVFGAARKAGYATRPGHDHPSRLRHAAFGMVLGEDHRPFRTRSGENVRLRALLDEALARARGVVRAKNPGIDEASCEEIARGVAVAAMRHADLSNDRVKDYVFSFERMLAFEGNTGPYLQYALVRVRKILAEAEQRGMSTGGAIHIEDASERALALTLLRYPGTLVGACEALEPHRVVGYLYDLATVFSTFYDRCHVLHAEDERVRSSRLRLCRVFERVLADGLGVLGIPALARM